LGPSHRPPIDQIFVEDFAGGRQIRIAIGGCDGGDIARHDAELLSRRRRQVERSWRLMRSRFAAGRSPSLVFCAIAAFVARRVHRGIIKN
jgi:hypothetical protein